MQKLPRTMIRLSIPFISMLVLMLPPVGSIWAAAKQPPGTVVVSGKVLHDNRPVRGARLYLHTVRGMMWETAESTAPAARSGGDGSFRFPVERYKLDGEESYHLTLIAYSPKYAIASVRIEKKTDLRNIVIELGDTAPLSGVVREKSGRPVQGAEVKIRYIWTIDECDIPEMTVKTDGKGRFTFSAIPAWTSAGFSITAPGYGFEYHSQVKAGRNDVVVTLAQGGRIEGRLVYGDTGKPAEGYTVSAIGTDTWLAGGKPATTDRDGRFLITNARPDSYTVSFGKKPLTESGLPDYVQTVYDTVAVSEGKTVRMRDIKLVRGGVITGRVTKDDTGGPVPGVWVASARAGRANTGLGGGKTDAEGRYRIRVMPGKAIVYIFSAPPEGYIGYRDGRDIKEVDVAEGKTCEADLRVRKAGVAGVGSPSR